jgi:hypothetical protein
VQLPLVGDQAVLQPRVLAVEIVDERTEGRPAALDGLAAAGVGAQDGRDPDLDGHGVRFSSWTTVVECIGAQRTVLERGNAPAPPAIPPAGEGTSPQS